MNVPVTFPQLEPLTVEEETERLRLERKIEKAFYEAGLALKTLREKKLYRSTHNTFEEYCKDRFDRSRRSVYYLIDAVSIVDNLQKCEPLVHILPTSERQCRPLKLLKPEQQQKVWHQAVKESGGKVPTARLVGEIVASVKPQRQRKSLITNREYLSLIHI